ncbi:EamA family transporter [Tetzosporium hominis]|uniref:EamA family transporter n=1 Tax=Tetzosporium hominis TaxID=2020506 RepID=A0A264W237_9BACL|nr:DMT family transporter [Tetzosporium hominis]OZS77629.1 EamA family transporter [Tetzosporium hominis]
MNSQRYKGIGLILAGAMLWGASGPMMEWLLEHYAISVPFFLTIRLIVAGLLVLVVVRLQKVQVLAIWREAAWRMRLVIFGIFGMLAVQFTFVAAIDASNATVATLLQFIGPVYIILFVSWRLKKRPPAYQVIGMVGTLGGLVLLLTNGNFAQLAISGEALFWGIAVGIAFAFYTVYPARLMQEWGVLIVVGWGMVIGGVVLGLVSRVWASDEWSQLVQPVVIGMTAAIIVVGTVAFILFLSSMKYITAVETSILSSMEPLTAMVISFFWFSQLFGPLQYVGMAIMLVFITWLTIAGEKQSEH